MDLKTAELIFALKGRLKNIYPVDFGGGYCDIVKNLLAKNNGIDDPYNIPKEWVDDYVKEAVLDFSKTLETTTAFLIDYFESRKIYSFMHHGVVDDTHYWCAALALTRVKDEDGNYINGFSEKLLENVLKENLKDLASYLNFDED